MSLAKAVPEGLKDHECKRISLCKCPPVPYVPEKDSIQETVSALKSDQSLKTLIGEGAELCLPIWHCGTCKAFLMHVGLDMDTIEKQGHFKAYKEAQALYVEEGNQVKQAKAALAELDGATNKGARTSARLQLTQLTPNCKLCTNWTSRRQRNPQRILRPRQNLL
jgi:hypothetical protein